MIDIARLNQQFEQKFGSCVMASYAIVANYFDNNVNITDVFDEYCNIFKIPFETSTQSEQYCGEHLNEYCQNIKNWRGYEMTNCLHNNSTNHLFIHNRSLFTAQIYSLEKLTSSQYSDLVNLLKNNEALANVLTRDIEIIDNHSRTLCVDQNSKLVIHDSSSIANPKIRKDVNFAYDDILECIVYKKN
ncbi:MAG: hypothetical protein WCX48_05930 [Bacteroidales bacterium]